MNTTNPRFELISRMKRGDSSQGLAQFSPEENAAAASLVQEIHDYNLNPCPKPEVPVEVLAKVSRWAAIRNQQEAEDATGQPRRLST